MKTTRRFFGVLLAATALGVASTASAADSNLGRDIASNCANCHGTNGRSVGVMPVLAGRPQAELVLIVTGIP